MERARISHSDIYLDLLNLRNIARDGALGSPAQRLMSRLTRSPIPIAQQQLIPRVLKPTNVQRHLQEMKDIQKRSHDRSSKPLQPLLLGQVVRLCTTTGHSRLATVKNSADEPRSYIVDYDGTVYRRSRQHLLAVREPRHQPLVLMLLRSSSSHHLLRPPLAPARLPHLRGSHLLLTTGPRP